MRRFALIVLLLSHASNARADAVDQIFGLYVSGLKAGTITINGSTDAGHYTLTGAVSPTSVMRHFHDVGYSGMVEGTVHEGQLQPLTYHGNTRTENRESAVQMQFDHGVPVVDSYMPPRDPRPYDIDPTAQRHVIDPLTAAHLVFRDQPLQDLCNKTLKLFDGRRVSRVTLHQTEQSGAEITCTGVYTRVAGFSPDDMQERVNFPFTLVYTKGDAEFYVLSAFKTQTTFGNAEAARK